MAAPQEALELRPAGGEENEGSIQLTIFQELYAQFNAYHHIRISGGDAIMLFPALVSDGAERDLGKKDFPVLVVAPPNIIQHMGRTNITVVSHSTEYCDCTVSLEAQHGYRWQSKIGKTSFVDHVV